MTSRGKYTKHKIMSRDISLLAALPATLSFNAKSFEDLMGRYHAVIVKPSFGWGGEGVRKVTRLSRNVFQVHSGSHVRAIKGLDATFTYLKKVGGSRPHVVQRFIPLAKIGDRPFDLRVMVQRRKGGPWTVTGKLVKVAGMNHVITNTARSHGYVMPASTALARIFGNEKAHKIDSNIDITLLKAAKQLGRVYGIRVIGFDVGVDHSGKEYIIEPNFTPMLGLFRRLKDKSQYYRILRYKRG